MQTYTYEARNTATGNKVKGNVQADSERSAAHLIKDQGLAPLSIVLKNQPGKHFYNRVKNKEKVLFARQLATLVNAGLPITQSLRNVQQQASNAVMRVVTEDIISSVEGGQSLADSLKKHPDVFNGVFVSMVAAGEASGTLDKALDRLANQQEKDAEVMSKLRGAMIYPIVVLLVMLAVMVFMLVGVLPQVKTLYQSLSAGKMPFMTSLLMSLSTFIIKFWWLLVVIIIALAIFGRRWFKTPGGRRFSDKLKLRVKPFNRLFLKVYMARFARTGATLIASGLPLIEMLEIASDAVRNVYIQDSIAHSIEQVKGGKSLADSLKGDPYFLPLVPDMLKIGEQSGAIEEMMGKTADYYEKEVDNEIKNISALIEPVMMVMLGVGAIIIVVAVLLPIYGLANKSFVQ
jgi:type IV pilus assembly protein PilC